MDDDTHEQVWDKTFREEPRLPWYRRLRLKRRIKQDYQDWEKCDGTG